MDYNSFDFNMAGCYLKHVFIFNFDSAYLCICAFRDGCQVLGSKPELLAALFALTSDPSIAVAKDCYFILVNMSADKSLHQVIGPEQCCTWTHCCIYQKVLRNKVFLLIIHP